jgi:hypothetical protein
MSKCYIFINHFIIPKIFSPYFTIDLHPVMIPCSNQTISVSSYLQQKKLSFINTKQNLDMAIPLSETSLISNDIKQMVHEIKNRGGPSDEDREVFEVIIEDHGDSSSSKKSPKNIKTLSRKKRPKFVRLTDQDLCDISYIGYVDTKHSFTKSKIFKKPLGTEKIGNKEERYEEKEIDDKNKTKEYTSLNENKRVNEVAIDDINKTKEYPPVNVNKRVSEAAIDDINKTKEYPPVNVNKRVTEVAIDDINKTKAHTAVNENKKVNEVAIDDINKTKAHTAVNENKKVNEAAIDDINKTKEYPPVNENKRVNEAAIVDINKTKEYPPVNENKRVNEAPIDDINKTKEYTAVNVKRVNEAAIVDRSHPNKSKLEQNDKSIVPSNKGSQERKEKDHEPSLLNKYLKLGDRIKVYVGNKIIETQGTFVTSGNDYFIWIDSKGFLRLQLISGGLTVGKKK